MFDLPEVVLTKEQEQQYQNYVKEWEFRKNSNRNRFVDWGISNNIGDPFNRQDWLERPRLHNFEKFD